LQHKALALGKEQACKPTPGVYLELQQACSLQIPKLRLCTAGQIFLSFTRLTAGHGSP